MKEEADLLPHSKDEFIAQVGAKTCKHHLVGQFCPLWPVFVFTLYSALFVNLSICWGKAGLCYSRTRFATHIKELTAWCRVQRRPGHMPNKHICKNLEHHDSNKLTNMLTQTQLNSFVNQLLELSLLHSVRFPPVARSTSGQSVPRWMEQRQQKARRCIASFRRDRKILGSQHTIVISCNQWAVLVLLIPIYLMRL